MGLFNKASDKMGFKVISGLPLSIKTIVALKKTKTGINVGNHNYTLDIEYNNIVSIFYGRTAVEETKNKSTIGRAIVGGVLTGGIGAVVGGMSGIGTKTKSKKIMAVTIEYLNSSNQKELIILEDFMCIGTQKFIDSIKFQIKITPKQNTINNNIIENNDLDIPDQIRKLAELKNDGIISIDEFETKKAELLSRL